MNGKEQELVERVKTVEAKLNTLASKSRSTSTIIFILALIFAGVFGFYSYTAKKSIFDNFIDQPKTMIAAAEDLAKVDQQIKDNQKTLEKYVEQESPNLAKAASEMLRSQMPALREQLENVILSQSDTFIATQKSEFEKTLRTYVKNNRKTIAEALADLKKDPNSAEKVFDRLLPTFEKEIGTDLKTLSGGVLDGIVELNRKFLRLKDAKDLSDSEARLREILMEARGLTPKEQPKAAGVTAVKAT